MTLTCQPARGDLLFYASRTAMAEVLLAQSFPTGEIETLFPVFQRFRKLPNTLK